MTTATKLRADEITAALSHHTGSLERYRHWTGRLIYTPGIHDLAKLGGAFWLIDLVASHQITAAVLAEPLQVWTLTVHTDQTASVVADDGDGRVIAAQHIEHTDFPLPDISLYLADGVLLLPSEY